MPKAKSEAKGVRVPAIITQLLADKSDAKQDRVPPQVSPAKPELEEDRVPAIVTQEEPPTSVTDSSTYLTYAYHHGINENYGDALNHYVIGLQHMIKKNEEIRLTEEYNLTKLAMSLAQRIDGTRQNEGQIFKSFIGILNTFPNNAIVLNSFAVFLCKVGEHRTGFKYLKKAVEQNYLPAEKNLVHVIWQLVPRWHIRMINDEARNLCYEKAITKAIEEGYNQVLDIGTGCGILSLIAASTDRNHVKVTAFEENRTLHEIAEKVVKDNNLDNIQVIPRNSNDVYNLPDAGECNLILTEIFDAGLFSQNCLPTIKHALTYFAADKFQIIPTAAKLYITAIECPTLSRKIRYYGEIPELEIVDICVTEADPGPYDSEHLGADDFKPLSETVAFMDVDFHDLAQIEAMVGALYGGIPDLTLTITEPGTVHALAVWFDLKLDAETTVSTGPFDEHIKCWEQGIFYLSHPGKVTVGEHLHVQPYMCDSQLKFTVRDAPTGGISCYKVSSEVLSFLNDAHLVQTLIQTVESLPEGAERVFDFYPFPVIGLLVAKKGGVAYHVYKDPVDLNFLNFVLDINDIPSYKFICIDERTLDEYMMYLDPPDLVFGNFLRSDGSWNSIELAFNSNLSYVTYPKRILLKVQLIMSAYLDICNQVDDTKALNFKISTHFNEFSGNEHPGIESLRFDPFSTVVSIDVSCLETIDFHAKTKISKDGAINAILYWFVVQNGDTTDTKFDTSKSWYYKRACTLLNTHRSVKEGEKVVINVLRVDGFMKIYLN